MTRTTIRTRVAGAALGLLALGLSGCGLGGGVYDAPLPGGADVGSRPVKLTAEFADVLDLVPQSNVKVDNVTVGRVTKVELSKDGRTAEVEMEVRRDADLRRGTTARLQQTSLLGEKYVALVPPASASASSAKLASGTTLGTADTDAAATAEQVLGSLSLVLNGGGVGQFQEISRELQKVGADGRTAQVKGFIEQLDRFVSVLDSRRTAITGALDGLARLSTNLDADRTKIAGVLDDIAPGLGVLRDQRPELTRMLTALDKLSKVTVSTLNASQADIVADLKALDPILSELAAAGDALPASLQMLLTFPFPDSVIGAIKGDYFNLFISTAYSSVQPCASMGCPWPAVTGPSGRVPGRPGSGGAGSGASSDVPPTMLPSTDSAVPGGTPTVPGPSIRPSDRPSSGSSSSGSSSPSAPGTSGPTGSPSGSGSPSQSDSPGGSDSPSSQGGQ